MNMLTFPADLNNEIWDYCRLNGITNIDEFKIKLLRQGFTVEKYGATPESKVVEKIVEVIKEVPVEKIVEKVITNDEEIQKLHQQLQEQNTEIEELKTKLKEALKKKDIYGEG